MSIIASSWADLGYRKLGPLPASGTGMSANDVAKMMTRHGGYESTRDQWVRRRTRQKNVPLRDNIEFITVLDNNSVLDEDCLRFVDEYAASSWVQAEQDLPTFFAESETLTSLVNAAGTEDRWRGMYRLSQALFFAGRKRLRPVLRDYVAPCFFKLYPKGKIAVLRYDTSVDESAAVLRILYAMAQTPVADLGKGGFAGIQTLQDWHLASLTRLMPALVDLFAHLFYPFVGGIHAGPPGLEFLFLFEPAEQHMPAVFPRNWLGFPNASAGFGQERMDSVKVITDFPGPTYLRAGHQRFQHAHGFTVDERLSLLRWFVGRFNRLLYELTDAANFTEGHDPQAPIDPVIGFEHQLTVDRLFRKTLLAMSLDETTTAKFMVFEIADLLDGLGQCFCATGKTGLFKILFNTQEGPALIAPRLATLPAPFGCYLRDLAVQTYSTIENAIIASVWLRSKVTPNGVLVRNKDLTREELKSRPEFVADVMRAYRNAHHGYFTVGDDKQNRPSRFLFPVNGNLPVEMSVLPVLWWLAYLADPSLVGWKHLEVGHYD